MTAADLIAEITLVCQLAGTDPQNVDVIVDLGEFIGWHDLTRVRGSNAHLVLEVGE